MATRAELEKEHATNGAQTIWEQWRYLQDVLGDGKVPAQMNAAMMNKLYPGFNHQAMFQNKKSAFMGSLPAYMKIKVAAKNCGEGDPEVLKKWIKHASVCSPAMWMQYFKDAPCEFAVDKQPDGSGRCGLIVSYSNDGGGLGDDCRKACRNFIVCMNLSALKKLCKGDGYYSTNHLKALKVFFDKKTVKNMAPMVFTAIGFFIVDKPFPNKAGVIYPEGCIIGNSCCNASIGESLGSLSMDTKVMTPIGTWTNPSDHGRATGAAMLGEVAKLLIRGGGVKGFHAVCDVTNGNKLHRI